VTPLKQLIRWVIDVHGGRVHRDLYRVHGIALGCPPPGQNAAFGTRHPLLVRDGHFRVVTGYGRGRARVWEG
jgi:hypothetical protein